jgi:hypothetical protein
MIDSELVSKESNRKIADPSPPLLAGEKGDSCDILIIKFSK